MCSYRAVAAHCCRWQWRWQWQSWPPSCGSRRPPLLWVPVRYGTHTALEIFGAANGTDLTACCTCSMVIQALRHATRLKRLAVAVLPYWLLLTLIPKV